MEPRKQAIIDALNAFVRQRPGLEFGNYGDVRAYRSEMRSITKDLHHYRELERAVILSDTITADALLEAARSAYSGRLTLKVERIPGTKLRGEPASLGQDEHDRVTVDYCTGQYFPTEYRRAACAVLASALWSYTREHCMPAPTSWRVESWGAWNGNRIEHERSKPMQIHEACALLEEKGGQPYGHVQEYHDGKTPGDWLRAHFRRQFGRAIGERWFS